jgi:hypothetical protein
MIDSCGYCQMCGSNRMEYYGLPPTYSKCDACGHEERE